MSENIENWKVLRYSQIDKIGLQLKYVYDVIISQCEAIFIFRQKLFKVGHLEVLHPYLICLYHLNSSHINQQCIKLAFQYFQKCQNNNDQLYMKVTTESLQMCFEIIYNFSANPQVYQKIIEFKLVERIKKFYM